MNKTVLINLRLRYKPGNVTTLVWDVTTLVWECDYAGLGIILM